MTNKSVEYWNANIRLVTTLLIIWFVVSYLFGIILVDPLNTIRIGGVGLGKTHLATALGYQACLKGYSVLFAPAIDTVNNLIASQLLITVLLCFHFSRIF